MKRHSSYTWLYLLSVQFLAVAISAGADEPTSKKSYVIFPVTTELQKREFFRPETLFFMVVNGDEVVDDQGRIDPSGLSPRDIWKDTDRERSWQEIGRIAIHVHFSEKTLNEVSDQFLRASLEGIGMRRGIKVDDLVIISPKEESRWAELMKVTKNERGLILDSEKENAIQDEYTRAYRIKTKLSRFHRRERVCEIYLLRPLPNDYKELMDDSTKKSVIASMKKLGVSPQNDKISVTFLVPSASKFFRETREKIRRLSDDLGIDNMSIGVRHK